MNGHNVSKEISRFEIKKILYDIKHGYILLKRYNIIYGQNVYVKLLLLLFIRDNYFTYKKDLSHRSELVDHFQLFV